jgi:thiamine-phosphate pyrophosphorylase
VHTLRIIVITDTKDATGERETIEKLFRAGMRTLHIRKPGYSRKKMRQYIESIPGKHRDKLVLHSHHGLAIRYGLKGVHFTEGARRPMFLAWLKRRFYRNLQPSLSLTASYHSLAKVEKLRDIYEYIFLSPVFESISKKHTQKPLRHSRIQDCLRLTKAKVVALGGVDETKILACRDMGFYGVGLVGSIWQSEDPVATFKEIQELCRGSAPFA